MIRDADRKIDMIKLFLKRKLWKEQEKPRINEDVKATIEIFFSNFLFASLV